MKLDGQDLPEAVVAVWLGGIDRLPPGDVRLLAHQRPAVMRGLRPAAIDPRIARDRLKAELMRSPDLPADIRAVLRAHGLASPLLVVLSAGALDRVAAPLAALFGVPEIAAAVLLDDRRAVRDHAASRLAGRVATRLAAVDQEAAAARLLADSGPLFSHQREILAAHDRARAAAVDGADAPPAAQRQAAGPAPRPPRPQREAKLAAALRDKRKEALRLARENHGLQACLEQAMVGPAARSRRARRGRVAGNGRATPRAEHPPVVRRPRGGRPHVGPEPAHALFGRHRCQPGKRPDADVPGPFERVRQRRGPGSRHRGSGRRSLGTVSRRAGHDAARNWRHGWHDRRLPHQPPHPIDNTFATQANAC